MQEPTENPSSSASPDVTALDTNTGAAPVTAPEVTSSESKISSEVSETTDGTTPLVVDTTTAASTPAAAAGSIASPALKQYGIAAAIVLIMGVALWYLLEQQGRVQTGVFADIKALFVPEPAAVLVNGEKVPVSLYEKNIEQLTLQAASQGADVSDPAVAEQIKQQAIDVITNSTLLRQAAVKAGIEVTDEQIDTRYKAIVESQGGEEELLARMAELKITRDSLMQDINDEILIQAHLSSTVDTSTVTVTDDEVEALYKSVTSNPAIDVPPLAEVRPQIEQEIRFGKEQELISEYLEKLKTDAKIEVLI